MLYNKPCQFYWLQNKKKKSFHKKRWNISEIITSKFIIQRVIFSNVHNTSAHQWRWRKNGLSYRVSPKCSEILYMYIVKKQNMFRFPYLLEGHWMINPGLKLTQNIPYDLARNLIGTIWANTATCNMQLTIPDLHGLINNNNNNNNNDNSNSTNHQQQLFLYLFK